MKRRDTVTLSRARRGDRSAFSALAEPYRRELVAYCYRLTGKLSEAEDLAQEALVRAFRGMESFEGRASARAWLYRIAHNLCINHVERSGPDWGSLDDADAELRVAPAAAAEEKGQERENVRLGFVALLQSLPPKQRAALVLRDVLGWSAEETARILETTVPAVKNALARARKTLSGSQYKGDPANVHDFASADPEARLLVAQWVDAFEKGNTATMVELLTENEGAWRPLGAQRPLRAQGNSDAPSREGEVSEAAGRSSGGRRRRPEIDYAESGGG